MCEVAWLLIPSAVGMVRNPVFRLANRFRQRSGQRSLQINAALKDESLSK